MDYKKTVEELKAFFNGQVEKDKEVKLADETAEVKEEVKEAPVAQYVTLEQFNGLKEEQEKFMVSVTEMLSAAMEMINKTEKNTVPEELSEEVKEEEVKEEVVELAAPTIVHDPEGLEKEVKLNVSLNPNRKKTTEDIVFQNLWGSK